MQLVQKSHAAEAAARAADLQPEVCAEAVFWAAHQHHREVFVGWPTVRQLTMAANTVATTFYDVFGTLSARCSTARARRTGRQTRSR
jgi:hypothetical protein